MAALVANGRARVQMKHPAKQAIMYPGDTIALTIGAETFSPVKYFTFTVGPVTGSVVIRDGELADAAYVRLGSALMAMFECEFATKCEQFLERLRDVVKYAGANKAHR